MMAGMEGTWRKAVLRGSLRNEGWGAGQGFPGFLWDGSNTPVAAQVFSSRDLPQHWQRLDDFEGAEYQRILVPVEILPQQAKTGLPPHQAKRAPVGDPGLAGDPGARDGWGTPSFSWCVLSSPVPKMRGSAGTGPGGARWQLPSLLSVGC